MFAGLCSRENGTCEFDSGSLRVSSPHPAHIHCLQGISGDTTCSTDICSTLGTGPPKFFFRHLKKVKVSSWRLLGLDCFQFEIIAHARDVLGCKFAPQYHHIYQTLTKFKHWNMMTSDTYHEDLQLSTVVIVYWLSCTTLRPCGW